MLQHEGADLPPSSAFKYSSKVPTPRTVVSGAEEGSKVVYTVMDNGAGFEPKDAEKLSGVFQWLNESQDFQGTARAFTFPCRLAVARLRPHSPIMLPAASTP